MIMVWHVSHEFCLIFQNILDETRQKLTSLDGNVWGKVYYMEKSNVLAKVYLKDTEFIVDNSPQAYDGKVYVLNWFVKMV